MAGKQIDFPPLQKEKLARRAVHDRSSRSSAS